MKMKRLAIGTLLGATSLLCATSAIAKDCTPAHHFKTVKPGVITHAAVNYMPFSAVGPDGRAIGVDGTILRKIAKMECLKVDSTAVDATAALNYVVSGRADVATGDYYRTAQRARAMALSNPLYIDQMAVISRAGYDKISSLKGKLVGSIQGDLWVQDVRKIPGVQLKLYPGLPEMLQDMQLGRINAALVGDGVAVMARNKGQLKGLKDEIMQPDKRVSASIHPGQGSFPMSKRNPEMLKAFNEDIAELHRNGFIKKALKKYGLDPSAAKTGKPRLMQ